MLESGMPKDFSRNIYAVEGRISCPQRKRENEWRCTEIVLTTFLSILLDFPNVRPDSPPISEIDHGAANYRIANMREERYKDSGLSMNAEVRGGVRKAST
jgi:hypothetical protein